MDARGARLAALTAFALLPLAAAPAGAAAPSTGARVAVATDAARYAPGHAVTFTVQLNDPSRTPIRDATLVLRAEHLGAAVATLRSTGISLGARETAQQTLTWTPPAADHRGYLVQAELTGRAGTVLGTDATAVDVSSDASTFPRYGFVSRYDDGVDVQAVERSLNAFHIDDIQFYDWEHSSHLPLAGTPDAPAASWHDIAGRVNKRAVVLDLIAASHAIGADTYSYNTLYNAWAGYAGDGSGVDPRWGLYRDNGCSDQVSIPLPAGWSTSALETFDPADPGWRAYILGREQDVLAAYPFDGWQVDQLGNQGTVYDCAGAPVDLASTFRGFLDVAASKLGAKLVFNAVGQYGQQQLASDPRLAFLYTEAWPANGQSAYDDLARVIAQNDAWSGGARTTVLAAYLDQSLCTSAGGTFNAPGVLLADAAIFAHGGDHIELGDVNHMLCAPYFPNTDLAMSPNLTSQLHHYYDFLVAYENVLRGGRHPSSSTIRLPGVPSSANGSAQTVWTVAASSGGAETLNFINLLRNHDESWGDPFGSDPPPRIVRNIAVSYCDRHGTPHTVELASPDIDDGAPSTLRFTHKPGTTCIRFTIPRLQYWDLVWVATTQR
jgi:dextranase